MNDHTLIEQAVDRLETARRTATPTAPVRDVLGSTDVSLAYRVQSALNDRRSASGARVTGRKIGLTNPAVQTQLGVDQPDFGVLFDEMAFGDGDDVPVGDLLAPKVEAEVAFVLTSDLDGDITDTSVRAAVGHAVVALEIVDSRVADWDISIVDTVADNGSSALYVLGEQPVTLDAVEPREVEMTLRVDDEIVSTGNGAACLGDPLAALAWLARTAQELGDPLRAGQVVLSGALGPMVAIEPGQSVRAEVTGLGSVSVRLVGAR